MRVDREKARRRRAGRERRERRERSVGGSERRGSRVECEGEKGEGTGNEGGGG